MEKRLVVKLNQYAGNVDEVVCSALTGSGCGRHGEEEGKRLYNEKIFPLIKHTDEEYPYLPAEFCEFSTRHGSMPYGLDSLDSNSLVLGIDSYTETQTVLETIEIWKQAYGEGGLPLSITYKTRDYSTPDSYKEHTVQVLGFSLVEIGEKRTEL